MHPKFTSIHARTEQDRPGTEIWWAKKCYLKPQEEVTWKPCVKPMNHGLQLKDCPSMQDYPPLVELEKEVRAQVMSRNNADKLDLKWVEIQLTPAHEDVEGHVDDPLLVGDISAVVTITGEMKSKATRNYCASLLTQMPGDAYCMKASRTTHGYSAIYGNRCVCLLFVVLEQLLRPCRKRTN